MLDARSPLVVDTHELGRRPGAMRTLERDIELDEAMGIEVIRVPLGGIVRLDGRIESVVEGILVSADLEAEAVGECVRCLEEVRLPIFTNIQELYIHEPTTRGRGTVQPEFDGDDGDELLSMEGDLLSLREPVRDALVLELPLRPLCSPDCPGLCSECGAKLADHPEHKHAAADPRWEALRDLLEE
jgi:uncharacterized protein